MRGFRDRDFIRTQECFLFCVVGPYHPIERVISYLKYVPSELGSWGRGKEHFSRVMRSYTIPSLLETFRLLESDHSQYLFHSNVYNITISAVPHEYIIKHYKPEKTLAQIFQKSHPDLLQEKLRKFVFFLAETSGVGLESFGVTGSILLDIHRPEFSDMDITIYGLVDSLQLKRALMEMNPSSDSGFRRFEGEGLKAWCKSKTRNFPLTMSEALKIYERKWNFGIFEDTLFSIHPIKLEQEVNMTYGDEVYYPFGQVMVRAVVHDEKDSMFLPAVYQVEDVDILDGPPIEGIGEVVSFEGLYGDLAEVGQTIVVKGKLERTVRKRDNHEHYRILVGSPEGRGTEYIKLLPQKNNL